MVFEKLSKEKHLDQLKIIKILKEVWEPEIIFSDYLDEDDKKNKKENKELFFEKLLRNWWVRDNKNAWVLWISETLANKIWIQVSLMRIILVLLICVWWVSIWFYIIAWIIMPLKWKNYSGIDTLSYFKYQIIKAIKDWAYNLSGVMLIIIKYLSSKSGKIIKFFFKNIFPVIRFTVCFSIWLFFLWLLFAILVMWAMYFTSFSIENIDFTSILPYYFIYWIIAWIIALSILSTSNFVYAISWKNLNKYILSLWWISLLLAVFFWLSTWFDIVEKYADKNENIQTTELNLWENWSGELNIELLTNDYNNIILSNHNIPNIKLENITWSILKVTVKNTIYGNDEISKEIFDWLSNLALTKENNKVILTNENNKLFNKKVPFTIIKRDIILKIPEWYSLNFGNIHWFNIENAEIIWEDFNEKYYENINSVKEFIKN
jgi:phage shock protein PspC (stress-responsive transcriptional regulator)